MSDHIPPALIIVMGTAGCGKSTLGKALADHLQLPFIDADDLHPPESVSKMSRGIPLNDDDREPWLRKIRSEAERIIGEERTHPDILESSTPEHPAGLVVACSALRAYYREILRGHDSHKLNGTPPASARDPFRVLFLWIHGEYDLLLERMHLRQSHFMKARMLDSQLATLEDPRDEKDVGVLELADPTEKQVADGATFVRETLAK